MTTTKTTTKTTAKTTAKADAKAAKTAKAVAEAVAKSKVALKDDLDDVDTRGIRMTTESRMVDITFDNTFGIVTGQTIYGINFLKEIIGFIQDILGGKMYLFEMDFKDARKRCIKQMIKQARKEWPLCNAIVNVEFNIMAIGGVVAIITTGTAVRVEETERYVRRVALASDDNVDYH